MCLTSIPCRTGSVHARTPGQPSTSTRQFGHWPAQQSSPRGRWYLKLREIVRRPEAWSAEPIVSPSYASTRLPSNSKVTGRPRSIRSFGREGAARSFGQPHPAHLVRGGVAVRHEPRPAAGPVVPPLPLDARKVAAEVVVRVQLPLGRLLFGRGTTSPPKTKSVTSRGPQFGQVSRNDMVLTLAAYRSRHTRQIGSKGLYAGPVASGPA